MTADEALAALGRRIDDLAQIPLRAWERWRSGVAPKMAKPPKSTRASVMQALMVEEMETAFEGAVNRRGGRALLCTVPGLVVQCKKLDERGMPRNYPTKTAHRFACQIPLPGFPPGTRLTLGYMLNAPGTGIAEVRLLAQMGKGVAWSRELTVNQTVMSIVTPTGFTIPAIPSVAAAEPPTPPTPPPAPAKKRTLQARGTAKAKRERKPGS